MACFEDPDDGCPPGRYRCRSCNSSVVCKPCPSYPPPDSPVHDDRWSWCAGKGDTALCVPMTAFPTKQTADAWFTGQGRPERVRLVVITEPDSVTWGSP